jgi:hypothetical protein
MLSTQRQEEVKVTVVIVSSMEAVHGPSMKDRQKVLRCNDKEMKKLARQMSDTVILGSMEIWRNNAKRIERGNQEVANVRLKMKKRGSKRQESNWREKSGEQRRRKPQ